MKKNDLLLALVIPALFLGTFLFIHFSSQTTPYEGARTLVQYPVDTNSETQQLINVGAINLPEFVVDLAGEKFKELLSTSKEQLDKYVKATIVHEVLANVTLQSNISIDKAKQKLVVRPVDTPNFSPGKYKLSLQLRTLEGEVNIDQDFTWGVIAVNTNKSIYAPGETAKIGFAVLNDNGETLCAEGDLKVDNLTLTIQDPQGNNQDFSLSGKTIKDSGECRATSFTNSADFQATYTTSGVGTYQMYTTATINGETREITDYFKVQKEVDFDIERTSFPTRIYPPSIYPTTFTIISKENYKGLVADTVPGNFIIEHVSDGGAVQKNGDFNHVVWQVDLKAGTPQQFTYFIKFPQVSPEFYLLGPITLGNFKEARQWQIASDAINSTSGLATWEDNGGSFTWSRVWTGLAWNPIPTATGTYLDTDPDDSRWFVEKSSPKTAEKLVALIDNATGTNDQYFMFTWSGSAWSESFNIVLGVATDATVTRAFDVAYEELSGDALFVYSDYSNSQLLYRRRSGGSWDGSSSNAGTAYDVYKRWIRLEPQFNSDSILVGYLNNNERVGAMIWDGVNNTFGDQFADDSGTATATSDEQAFDIAWESSSGTPMIFWGTTGNALVYREFTSGTWQAEANAATGFTNDSDWVKVAADPVSTSNNISLAVQDNTACRLRYGVWTGSSATMNATTHACQSVSYNNLIDTKFESSTNKAMYVAVITTYVNRLSWLTWTSAGGFTSITTEAGQGTTSAIEGIQLYSDLNSNSMITLYHDNSGSSSNCRLWDREWDGSSWSVFPTGKPQEDNLCASADNDTEPYGFGFDRNLETFVAYRFFTNANSLDVGSPLTGQDTPYTLTQASQQFRLRILLYYPDILLTSSSRQYALQYVDPGTGTCASPTGGTPSTWTNVPTSAGQINFYNNNGGGVTDGADLTANANDPTYRSYTVHNQDYEEANNFTNSVTDMAGDEVAKWDFSLVDNTTYDRVAQTFCFRVVRSGSTDLPLRVGIYPQMTTAALADVLIQGGSNIRQGTQIR
jgi:hypothetical protein